jgi:hypothetical protein
MDKKLKLVKKLQAFEDKDVKSGEHFGGVTDMLGGGLVVVFVFWAVGAA